MKLRFLAPLFLPLLALAQAPPPADAPTGNFLKNGDFERFTDEDNLWDGVDQEGFLAGDAAGEDITIKNRNPVPRGLFFKKGVGRAETILDGGQVGKLPMPISVQVADLNHDGLLDLITVDGSGYFRVYFNSGTPTAPKFTHCEMVPLFLGRFPWINKTNPMRNYGEGLKLALGDFDKSGTQDLMLGNYFGDLMLIKNSGTLQVPEWRQPSGADAIKIPTTKDGHLWANLLAPAVYDWNRDGKMDVLVGEGSYSANAIHLLLNVGGGLGAKGVPMFNEDAHEYLAYGDGREQLVPAVVDYNGDGIPDLLVGDRLGNINVYLSDGPWKKGAELKREPQPISFGGQTSVGVGNTLTRCVAPAVADLNGDGKFDIIVGKPNGRIAVAYNIGTPTEPKFGPLVELKGEDVLKKGSIREPMDWSPSFGYREGNFYGYYTVVTPAEDPEAAQANGQHVLKFGYQPVLNRIIRKPPLLHAGTTDSIPDPKVAFQANGVTPFYWGEVDRGSFLASSNVAILRQSPAPEALKPNGKYLLSFRVKGRNVRNGHATVLFGGWLLRDVEAAKAGTGAPENRSYEALRTDVDFPVTPAWVAVSKPVSFRFSRQPDLNEPEKWNKPGSKIEYRSLVDIRATLNIDDSVFYIDDVKLTPM